MFEPAGIQLPVEVLNDCCLRFSTRAIVPTRKYTGNNVQVCVVIAHQAYNVFFVIYPGEPALLFSSQFVPAPDHLGPHSFFSDLHIWRQVAPMWLEFNHSVEAQAQNLGVSEISKSVVLPAQVK